MGLPTATTPEAAPAYDDVFGDHPYAAVAQDDDVEMSAHEHAHDPSSLVPSPEAAPESLAQTIAGVFRPKPHTHCEQCDVQLAARQRRENERHCCDMVALVAIVAFASAFVFGIILLNIVYKHKKS
ncbi:hypothetical protein GQ44DRAFT_615942 [Phaeosphaeriaceae sp. PMI808]|nr:hypothetical protein GQ44DRAFT_615942 [Phaeosphaeriaceae sp. PMI808]